MIAEVVFGQYSPGGKMPYTVYPAAYSQQVDFQDMSMTTAASPQKGLGRTYRFYTGKPLYEFG